MGLFGVLGVANRGLLINQRGIAVTSHNIANVDTPGYSRQRQVVESVRGLTNPNGSPGLGVEQVSIQRISDRFVQDQLIREHASAGSLDVQRSALAQIESVVNEQGAGGLTGALDAFYAAISDLASATTPGQAAERESLRAAATGLIETFHRYDSQLRDIQRTSDRSVQPLLDQANQLADRIADLNTAITGKEAVTPATDLRDQRDAALRELADLVNIQHFEQDDGSVVVLVAGGLRVNQLTEVADPTNPFDPTFSRIAFDDGVTQTDITAQVGGGRIGGHLAIRDSVLPGAIRALDTVAYNLSEQINAVHNLGQGLNAAVGDFFAPLAAVEDAAANIALDAAIVTSTDAIAAGLSPNPGDNRNALALAALRDQPAPIFLPGDPPGPATGPTRTVPDHWSAIVADIGQQARVVAEADLQQQRTLRVVQDRRDEISGVSLDEEMGNLIRLEAAFQANARVVASVDEMLESLIGLL